jgi:DNA-binding HxlR family transcriptional regulator
VRTGAYALSLLAVPLNVQVLTSLGESPKSLMELRMHLGSPPQTTARKHLRVLTELGLIERRRQADFPGSVDFSLCRPGRDLLAVADSVERWLSHTPNSAPEIGTPMTKSALTALCEGWSSGIVRVLAAKPHALTELSRLITKLSYPSLERRLAAMRLVGLIDRCPSTPGRGTPYQVTEQLRFAIAPLTSGARWERQHLPMETPAIKRIDVEAAFLLTLSLLDLSEDLSGICRLAMELPRPEGERQIVGVTAEVREGKVVSCLARLQSEAHAWVSGGQASWLEAVIDGSLDRLDVGGDCELAMALVDGLNGALFPVRERAL